MKAEFKVGDRIWYPGIPPSRFAVLPPEGPRFAVVIKTYNGKPSALDPGVPLMDIQFEDDKEIKKHCMNIVGVYTWPPIFVPSVWLPNK